MKSERLDLLLVERELAESREKAQRLIRAGRIRVNDQVESKPGKTFVADVSITLEQPPPYVSRGGQKLEAALYHFEVPVHDRVCIDVGSSTGGFTDCLLQRGATKVYAVDVGKGQLHWNLRNDSRVVVMEKTNARYLESNMFPEPPSLVVIDVSFISLTLVMPAVKQVIAGRGHWITLIKPQFEAGRDQVGKGGVVKDPEVHQQVIRTVQAFGTDDLGLEWQDVIPSPLKGPAGNIEFLAYWKSP